MPRASFAWPTWSIRARIQADRAGATLAPTAPQTSAPTAPRSLLFGTCRYGGPHHRCLAPLDNRDATVYVIPFSGGADGDAEPVDAPGPRSAPIHGFLRPCTSRALRADLAHISCTPSRPRDCLCACSCANARTGQLFRLCIASCADTAGLYRLVRARGRAPVRSYGAAGIRSPGSSTLDTHSGNRLRPARPWPVLSSLFLSSRETCSTRPNGISCSRATSPCQR